MSLENASQGQIQIQNGIVTSASEEDGIVTISLCNASDIENGLVTVGDDYSQYIAQLGEPGQVVALVEQHGFDQQQENIDPQQSIDANQLVHHIVAYENLQIIPASQINMTPAPKGRQEIQPPVGKGPYKCESCDRMFNKWNQYVRHQKVHEEDKPFACQHCPASFNVEDNLRLHEATHVIDGVPTCPECGKTFTRVASLKAHIMLHEKEENLMCTECGDEFCVQSQLDKHMAEHRQEQQGTKSYPCRQCTQEFPKPHFLREHMKQHYKVKSSLVRKFHKRNLDRSSFQYVCKHCGKSFQKPSQLERHMRIHTGERPYKCNLCTRAFNQKGALQIHMTKHTGEKPFDCAFCPMTFAQKGNLRAHIHRVHSIPRDTEGTYECPECSCVFKKLGSLNAHISRSHTIGQESDAMPRERFVTLPDNTTIQTTMGGATVIASGPRNAGSDSGNLSAGQKSQLSQTDIVNRNHDILQQALQNSGLTGGQENVVETTAATQNLQPIAPDTVQSQFMNQSITTVCVQDVATGSIKKHIIRKINGVRWHQCTYCTKEFKKPSDLVRHIRIHTHEKPYKCTQCYRAFAVKSTLTAHIKTHTGVKEYRCQVCGKPFSTLGSLKVHIRMHTGSKPYSCPRCDKSFRTSGHLKSHVHAHMRDGLDSDDPKHVGKSRPAHDTNLPEVALQEPILITDTGLIQQPPRNNVLNSYLGEAGTLDRPFKCNYCRRGFKKSSHLKQHLRSHTGERPYKCQQCLRSFGSSGVLKAHIRTHTGMRAYRCALCENTFTTNGSLKRHMSTHSEVRPFMCPYCQKTFKTSVNCKKHMKTHRHELALQAMQQNPQTCDLGLQEEVQTTENDLLRDTQSGDLGQELVVSSISQSDISQQNLLQSNIDVLNNVDSSLDQPFSQSLNQQLFGQSQIFNQSLLGTTQQSYQPMNNQQLNNQYQIQQNSSMDYGGFTQNGNSLANSTMNSTSMQNILPTNEMRLNAPQEGQEAESDSTMQQETPEIQEQAILRYPSDRRNYKCEICNRAFKKSSHLKQHLRSHKGEKPYKCMVCEKSFVTHGVLKTHMVTHTGARKFLCSVCTATFTTNSSLSRHMHTHEKEGGWQELMCDVCDLAFYSKSMYKRHMKSHKTETTSTAEIPVDFNHVGMVTRRKAKGASMAAESVAEEEEEEDGDEEQADVTEEVEDSGEKRGKGDNQDEEEVDLSISEKMLLEASVDNNGEETQVVRQKKMPKWAHPCSYCSKSFKKPSDLVRHIRTHTGERPFVCEVCSRGFTVKSTLDSHMKTHQHVEKKFKCHICSAMFSTKGSLKVHIRLHTGVKPFKCHMCDQRFRTSGHRKSHMLLHNPNHPVPKQRRKQQNQAGKIGLLPGNAQNNQVMTTDQQNQLNLQNGNIGQVINIDQSMLQGQNIFPMSLTLAENVGNAESALAANVLQSLDGIQLQLTGNIGQGIQISGLDPSLFSQTVQIDGNLLQQLQNQDNLGNISITINPNLVTPQPNAMATADPNLVQNISQQGTTGGEQVVTGIIQNIQDHGLQGVQVQNVGADNQLQGIQIQTLGQNQPMALQGIQVHNIGNDQGLQTIQLDPNTLQNLQIPGLTQGSLPQNIVIQQMPTISVPLSAAEDIQSNAMVTEQAATYVVQHDGESLLTQNAEQSTTSNAEAEGKSNNMPTSSVEIENAEVENNDDLYNEEEEEEDEDDDIPDDDYEDTEEGVDDSVPMMEEEPEKGKMSSQDSKGQESSKLSSYKVFSQSELSSLKGTEFRCGECNETFKEVESLTEHMFTHTSTSTVTKLKAKTPPSYPCRVCFKCFSKPSQLSRHERIHTGERPFTCPECNKSFNQKNTLQVHLKQHSGEKPHACSYCDLAFTQKCNLKSHIKRAHHMDMVHSMNINKPLTFVPVVSGNILALKDDERMTLTSQESTGQEEDGINLEEVVDFFPNC